MDRHQQTGTPKPSMREAIGVGVGAGCGVVVLAFVGLLCVLLAVFLLV